MTHHETQPDPDAMLLRRLVGGDVDAEAEVLASVADTTSVGVLVAAAVLTHSAAPLTRAATLAAGTRDRQLVVLGRALVEGADDLFDGLVRDHLASYPDHLMASWIATRTR
jgi:hypothetical protein